MIITPQEINKLNLGNQVIGLASGCMDLLHYYHLHFLERCKAQCDFLIVGVDSDELLTFFKSKQATIPEHHRVAMVAALRCVDAAFVLRNLKQFESIVPYVHKIFKNKPELYGQPIVGAEKAELVIIPDIQELTSTSEIVTHIKNLV